MTLENYGYRTSPFLLRNQFPGEGKLQIPVVPKFQIYNDDFDDLRFIGFDRTNLENSNHRDRMVHFFLYDYKFERVWKTPDADLEKLRQYRAVLTPDFSMYLEMSPVMKPYNVFRNRWCGAFWASKGLRVIPTVSWGGEDTFEYCFDGIEKGSTVAVSTYMATAHGNHSDQKDFFLKGYRELLRRIEPETILCYNKRSRRWRAILSISTTTSAPGGTWTTSCKQFLLLPNIFVVRNRCLTIVILPSRAAACFGIRAWAAPMAERGNRAKRKMSGL